MGLDMYFEQVPKFSITKNGKILDYVDTTELSYWRKSYTLHKVILDYGIEKGLIVQSDLKHCVTFQLTESDLDEIIIRYIRIEVDTKEINQPYNKSLDLLNLINGYDAFEESETLWFMDSW